MSDWFWSKVALAPGCWEWTGARNPKGYGTVNHKDGDRQVSRNTHRIVWERLYGSIPAGMLVMHKCDNPPCVKPTHLRLGTRSDNMRDMASKGRDRWRRS